MAFVNEYVSDEDVEKYELKQLMRKFNGNKWEPLSGFRFDWTIDRERDIFFMTVGWGKEDAPNRLICDLVVRGKCIRVWIDKVEGRPSAEENSYIMVWELAKLVNVPPELNMTREEVIALLKEALTAYGVRGIYRQIPNTLVRFTF